MQRILIFITSLLLFSPLQAMAEEFYVELGVVSSESEAQSRFSELQAENKILADYDVFPNAILQPDGSFAYRVQAGPMLDRKEANRTCNRLRKNKVSCFIIEGFDPQKPATFAAKSKEETISGSDFSPPWLQNKSNDVVPTREVEVTQAPQPDSGSGSLFGRIGSLFDSEPEKNDTTPAEVVAAPSNREAAVNVAEAIPVELSNKEDLQPLVQVGSAIEIADVNSSSSDNNSNSATQGWLTIQPFIDEDRAMRFWKHAQRYASERTSGLEMQVLYPVVSNDIPKVIASIGRFGSEAEANRFCTDVVVPSSRYLECHFSTSPPDGSRNRDTAQVIDKVIDDEHSLFWVELLSGKSQDAVLEQWERIRTDHDDLLMNVRSQITTSFSNPGTYLVRVGPLNAKSKADQLCGAMKARKLSCKVVGL